MDTAHLRSVGCNDKVSSVRCGPGVQCEIYVDAEYQGKSKVFSGDVPFVGSDFNDKASSVIISPPAGEVHIFKDSFYSTRESFTTGKGNVNLCVFFFFSFLSFRRTILASQH